MSFCHRCGASLEGAPTAPRPPPETVAAPFTSTPPLTPLVPSGTSLSPKRQREVDHTRTGALLLGVGSLFSWVPILGLLGGLLVLIGAILVILGSGVFGPKHTRNIWIAVALFVVGFLGGLFLAGGFVGSVTSAVGLPPDQAGPAVTAAFNSLLVGAVILGLITGWSTVIFLWELLNPTGKILAILSYAVALIVAVAVYQAIAPQVSAALTAAFATSPPDATPLLALDAQIQSLRLLNGLSSLLFAGAAFVAWSRIDKGEIPKRPPAPESSMPGIVGSERY